VTKILYLGFHHRHDDPRLFFRQMRVVNDRLGNAEFHFLGNAEESDTGPRRFDYSRNGVTLRVRRLDYSRNRLRRTALRVPRLRQAISFVRELRPDVIQASDAREIALALALSRVCGASPIYDSHEDYFRQAYEYGGRTPVAFLRGLGLLMQELVLLRFFTAVFCTDEFLLERYSQAAFGVGRVGLLRNLPLLSGDPRPTPRTTVSAGRALRCTYRMSGK
jgi:hypothetical protein